MKAILCVLLLAVSGAASAAVAVGPLPAPAYADTEVSTNFPFSVECVERGFRVRLL